MIAVDTNVLVRFLVGDDKLQTQKVKKLFKKVQADGELVYVSDTVVLELIWVLSAAYLCSTDDIISALNDLLLLSFLKFESHDCIYRLCSIKKNYSCDISDIFIGLLAQKVGCSTTLTFDKKALKTPYFKSL